MTDSVGETDDMRAVENLFSFSALRRLWLRPLRENPLAARVWRKYRWLLFLMIGLSISSVAVEMYAYESTMMAPGLGFISFVLGIVVSVVIFFGSPYLAFRLYRQTWTENPEFQFAPFSKLDRFLAIALPLLSIFILYKIIGVIGGLLTLGYYIATDPGMGFGAAELTLLYAFGALDSVFSAFCYYFFTVAIMARMLSLETILGPVHGRRRLALGAVYLAYIGLSLLKYCLVGAGTFVFVMMMGDYDQTISAAMLVVYALIGFLFVLFFRFVMLRFLGEDLSILESHLFEPPGDSASVPTSKSQGREEFGHLELE